MFRNQVLHWWLLYCRVLVFIKQWIMFSILCFILVVVDFVCRIGGLWSLHPRIPRWSYGFPVRFKLGCGFFVLLCNAAGLIADIHRQTHTMTNKSLPVTSLATFWDYLWTRSDHEHDKYVAHATCGNLLYVSSKFGHNQSKHKRTRACVHTQQNVYHTQRVMTRKRFPPTLEKNRWEMWKRIAGHTDTHRYCYYGLMSRYICPGMKHEPVRQSERDARCTMIVSLLCTLCCYRRVTHIGLIHRESGASAYYRYIQEMG
jgi:hypothetical protein